MGSFLRSSIQLASRASHQISQTRGFVNNMAVKKWAFNLSGFNQYGLYHDDAMYEYPDVKLALDRVPQHILDERAFRIQRALHLSLMKTVLPKEQWPTFEEDREKGRYLQPYLEEVKRELAEKAAWNKQA